MAYDGHTKEEKFELEKITKQHHHETMQTIIKYVAEDFRSQLLIIALTGTTISVAIAAYEKYVQGKEAENASHPSEPPKPIDPFFLWLLTGGPGGLIGGAVLGAAFKQAVGGASHDNPYSLTGTVLGAAETTTELAWGLLFLSVIMGDGGIGGLLKNTMGTAAAGAV